MNKLVHPLRVRRKVPNQHNLYVEALRLVKLRKPIKRRVLRKPHKVTKPPLQRPTQQILPYHLPPHRHQRPLKMQQLPLFRPRAQKVRRRVVEPVKRVLNKKMCQNGPYRRYQK